MIFYWNMVSLVNPNTTIKEIIQTSPSPISNFTIPFLYYRIHNSQTTHKLKNSTVRSNLNNELDKIIEKEINSEEINHKKHISSKKKSLARKHSLTKKHRKL